jgi:hypothetical protein
MYLRHFLLTWVQNVPVGFGRKKNIPHVDFTRNVAMSSYKYDGIVQVQDATYARKAAVSINPILSAKYFTDT